MRTKPAQGGVICEPPRDHAELRHQLLDLTPEERAAELLNHVTYDPIPTSKCEGDPAALLGAAGLQSRDGEGVLSATVYRIRAGASMQRETAVLCLHLFNGQWLHRRYPNSAPPLTGRMHPVCRDVSFVRPVPVHHRRPHHPAGILVRNITFFLSSMNSCLCFKNHWSRPPSFRTADG